MRLAMAALCAADLRLTHNARHWFTVFAWRYRPGQRFRDNVLTLTPSLMSRAAVFRVIECLIGLGYAATPLPAAAAAATSSQAPSSAHATKPWAARCSATTCPPHSGAAASRRAH